jgi:hypothetical protein
MVKARLLDHIAPCSLLCYACISFQDGPSKEGARNVYTYSDGWGDFWSAHLPEEKREEWHKWFDSFQNTLQYLGGASCPGCRNHPPSNKDGKWGCLEGCVIPSCVKERGLDFCAECDEFPCQKAKDFFKTPKGQSDWETGSRRIKEIGIDAYYDEKKGISHYVSYKKKPERPPDTSRK